MSTIPKPGDLVLIKTTEEPVIVLAAVTMTEAQARVTAEATNCFVMPSLTEVTVRRPVAGQNGISHQIDTFYLEEVEFPTDRNLRLKAEYQAMQTEQAKESPAATDSKSSIN